MVESAIVSTITIPVEAERPPMKTSSASAVLPLGERQAEHEGVGVHRPRPAKRTQPAEGDRRDEEVDDEQVEREEPDRGLHVALVDVLHDRHLELARQEEDREHRDERRGDERRPGRPDAASRRRPR